MTPEESKLNHINYFREAFQLPINLVFLAVAFFSFMGSLIFNHYFGTEFMINSIAILSGSMALELFYLAFMASNESFIKVVNYKKSHETNSLKEEIETAEILNKLSKESLKKFSKFFQRKNDLLRKSLEAGASDQGILLIIKENTDKLIKSYAQALYSKELFNNHLSKLNVMDLRAELMVLEEEIRAATGKKKQLLMQRSDLLIKRIKKLESIKEDLSVASIQAETIEDTLEFLYENSLTKSNLDDFIKMINDVSSETETYQNALREVNEMIPMENQRIE